jgi:hypothetical protein
MLFKSSGMLIYSENFKLNVEVDQQIVDYTRSLIPKSITIKKQKYKPHITVVRNEDIINYSKWMIYTNEMIDFEYDNYVFNNNTYYWLRAFSPKLSKIRLELGLLSSSQYSR